MSKFSSSSLTLPKRLYRLPDAAYYLSIPASMLRRMIAEGEIEFVRRQTRFGRILLIDKVDMDKWILENKAQNVF